MNKDIKTLVLVAVAVILLTLSVSIRAAGLVLIAHRLNPEQGVTIVQAKKIFLGRSKSFPVGGYAVPVDHAKGSVIRNVFYKKVAGKSEVQLNMYWSKMIFSGKATPPLIITGGDSAVKAWVSKNPSGVGYINSSAVDQSVKVLLIIP